MAWLRAGTVAVTNGSTTVTGTGAGFAANIRVGDAFIGPDGRQYELQNVASDTVISILPAYLGPTASGQPYAVMPVQGYQKLLADLVRDWTSQYGAKMAALGSTGNYDVLPVGKGGTGGGDQAAARIGLGLGTAATANITTSSTDSTTGRILKIGDLGLTGYLSRAPAGTNANTLAAFTHRLWLGSDSSGGPLPGDWIIEHVYIQPGYVTQQAQRLGGELPGVYTRAQIAGSWSEWVPSAIERVTNANGEAIKFPDGTMICTAESKVEQTTSNAAGSIFVGTPETFTFPAAFASISAVVPSVSYSTAAFVWVSTGNGATLSSYQAVGISGANNGKYKIRYVAIGRWK
ncbi:hypothetical protein ACRZ5O_08495 [Pseudomonas protegens]|uniref:hypothetical protein n=1 Tax=Pseudomonas protegens TaxID=380021 RepID=UPI003FD7D11A